MRILIICLFSVCMFFVSEGILIITSHPVSGIWIYHGEIQEIELEYVEFPERLSCLLIPYKEGKNVLVVRKNGMMREVCYGWGLDLE